MRKKLGWLEGESDLLNPPPSPYRDDIGQGGVMGVPPLPVVFMDLKHVWRRKRRKTKKVGFIVRGSLEFSSKERPIIQSVMGDC